MTHMEDEDIAPNTVHAADPVAMDRKLCLNTILEYSELARLSAPTKWTNRMYIDAIS